MRQTALILFTLWLISSFAVIASSNSLTILNPRSPLRKSCKSLSNMKGVSSKRKETGTQFSQTQLGLEIITSPHTINAVASASVVPQKAFNLVDALKLFCLFFVWYGTNVGYNVYNSYLKKDLLLPWTAALLQLLVGVVYVAPLWALKVRKIPKLTIQDILKLLPIAVLNAGGHVCAVTAMFEKGGGSFTHVIKASEPVVSVILGFLVNGVIPRPLTALSLLPISYGVAYASTLGNLNFKTMSTELTSKAAKTAMGSNVAFAMRSIMRKNLPSEFLKRTNLDPANEHAVSTFLSALLIAPLVFMADKNVLRSTYSLITDKQTFYVNVFFCGITYYLYNEMQNLVLGFLGPLATAVGNTLKRVAIFLGLYLFTTGETFPLPKVIGSAIAITGCMLFAIFDTKKI